MKITSSSRIKLLLLTIIFVLLTSTVTARVYVADNFDRADSPTIGGPFVKGAEPASTSINITNNQLRLFDGNGADGPQVYAFTHNATLNSTTTVTFKVSASATTSYFACGLYRTNAKFFADGWTGSYAISSNGIINNTALSHFDGAINYAVLPLFEAGKQYNVTYTNFSTSANTADHRINASVATGLLYGADAAAGNDTAYFQCFQNDGGTGYYIEIDDFCVFDAGSNCFPAAGVTPLIYDVNITSEEPTIRLNYSNSSQWTVRTNITDGTPTVVTRWNQSILTCAAATVNVSYSAMNITGVVTGDDTCTLTWPTEFELGNNSLWFAANSTAGIANNGTTMPPSQQVLFNYAPASLTVEGRSGNATIRETSQQTFSINVTFNVASITDINATFYFDNVVRTGVQERSESIGSGYNRTFFNVTFQIPLAHTNASTRGAWWNVSGRYSNGSDTNNVTTNTTHTTLWSFYFSPVMNLTPANAIEGQTATFNTTIVTLENTTGILDNVSFSHNNTITLGASQSVTTSAQVWIATKGLSRILDDSASNVTFSLNGSLTVSFGGTTLVRNSSLLSNQTSYKMILTECGADVTTQVTLRYDTYDESVPTNRIITSSTDNHVVSTSSTFNRTYGFTRSLRSNWTICIFPNFTGVTYSDYNTVQYGEGITYATRTNTVARTLTQTQQNVSLYTLNLSSPGVTAITINVQDQNGIGLANVLVQVIRLDLVTNNETIVFEDTTDPNGVTQSYLVTSTVYYKFKIFSDATKTHQIYSDNFRKIFASPITLRVGLTLPEGWDLYAALAYLEHGLTFNNGTKQWMLTWDKSNVPNSSSYNVLGICLRLDYNANASAVYDWQTHSVQCSTADVSSLTSSVLNQSLSDVWRVLAYANITGSPATPYALGSDSYTFWNTIGSEGGFWAAIVVGVVATAGIWNPVVFILAGIIALLGMGTVNVVAGITGLLVIIVVAAMFLIKMMKT
jgi:hypothetical protein